MSPRARGCALSPNRWPGSASLPRTLLGLFEISGRRLVLAALGAFALHLAILSPAAGERDRALAARADEMTVQLGRPLQRIPSSYLGLSVEDNELPRYERHTQSFAALLAALRPPGENAPVSLRVGGESADSSFWQPDATRAVAATYRQGHPFLLTPRWMSRLAELVRQAGANVILDLNLAAHSPKMAADVAAAARSALPRRGLAQFEIGNEPDLYARSLIGLERANGSNRYRWARRFTIHNYISLFDAYTRAIAAAVPGARFAGPSGMSRSPRLVQTLVSSRVRRRVSLVTAHNYPPFAGCALPGDPKYPRAVAYLRDSVSAGVAHSEHYVVDAARQGGLRVRLTEMGSAVCGGVAGRTDTFATALWAPDMLFNLLAVGVQGVNIHLRGNGFLNTALNFTRHGIYAEPLFYGLTLFARTLGPGARLQQVTTSGGSPLLKVWAVRLGDGSRRLLYINKSDRDTYVRVRAGRGVPAQLERLSAPSITANRTVTLAGQRLESDGLWHGTLDTRTVNASRGFYRVFVPAFSAALLSVPG